MHVFFVFFISRLKMHARCVRWVRVWVWGENYLGTSPAVWEHRYLCYESGAGVWSAGSLEFRVMVKNLSHWFCLDWATMSSTGRPCLGIYLLIFETFLGGALRHNVYWGYIVFWGTVIYCSLARALLLSVFSPCLWRHCEKCTFTYGSHDWTKWKTTANEHREAILLWHRAWPHCLSHTVRRIVHSDSRNSFFFFF